MKALLFLTVLALLCSCSKEGDESTDNIEVFKSAVNVLCGSGVGESLNDSSLSLSSKGVDVLDSRCSLVVDGNGDIDCQHFEIINIHAIRASNLDDAEELGYIKLQNLNDVYQLAESEIKCVRL